MTTAIAWLLGSTLMFIWFSLVGCSALGSKQRSRFYLRLSCGSVGMLAVALGVAFAIHSSALPQSALGLAWLALLLAALAVPPAFCYRTFARFHGPPDGDGGGGLGSGPPPPPPSPSPGGAPLPDADQARTRWRDHNRSSLRGVSSRRRVVEPRRRRAPARPGRQ